MAKDYEYGPGFGAIAMSEYEQREQARKEAEDRARWEREMSLKEKELEMKSQSNNDIIARLERIEQSLGWIEATLSRHETQYFYPFSLVIKDK